MTRTKKFGDYFFSLLLGFSILFAFSRREPPKHSKTQRSNKNPSGYTAIIASRKLRSEQPKRGILVLEGNGDRIIAALRVLEHLMQNISLTAEPYEYFDVIAGVEEAGSDAYLQANCL